jgi:hypothetical protein
MNDVFKLNPLGKSVARGNHGILELDPGKADFEIGSHAMAEPGCDLGIMVAI